MNEAEVRVKLEAGMCPICDAGPFKVVAGHTAQKHGVDHRALKDMAGLRYADSTASAELQEHKRQISLEQDSVASMRGTRRGAVTHMSRRAKEHARKAHEATTAESRERGAKANAARLAAMWDGRHAAWLEWPDQSWEGFRAFAESLGLRAMQLSASFRKRGFSVPPAEQARRESIRRSMPTRPRSAAGVFVPRTGEPGITDNTDPEEHKP